MNTLNWLAVLAAGISAFVLGGIWYSPALLGKTWMKETNLTEISSITIGATTNR